SQVSTPTPRWPLQPAAPPEPGASSGGAKLKPWAWATLGVGAGALLAAGGFELARRASERDARGADSQIEFSHALDTMHSRQTAARVFAGVGAAAVVSG